MGDDDFAHLRVGEVDVSYLEKPDPSPGPDPAAGEVDPSADENLATANAAALRARVRELEVENGLIQRELAHVGELAERQGQQLQCAAAV